MKSNRRMILSVVWVVLGASLLGSNLAGLLGDYWGGLGGGLLGVGVFQVVRNVRYLRNPEYREKVDTTNQDERNRFLANKAWAWAGYLFVMTAAVATIVFQIIGKTELATISGFGVCLIVFLYWISYTVLQKKY